MLIALWTSSQETAPFTAAIAGRVDPFDAVGTFVGMVYSPQEKLMRASGSVLEASTRSCVATPSLQSKAASTTTDAMEVSVAGASVTLAASGAAWIAAEQTLIVSDLHLEKGSAFAARGVFLPPYDTRATLEALGVAIAQWRPKRVVALGDSFHDAALDRRMADEDRARLTALVAAVDHWVWIVGNHDPQAPLHLGGEAAETLALGPWTLRHEPEEHASDGEIAGHLHPCARIRRRGRSVRRRCFVGDGRRLILPAFGAYAGGLNILDPAFTPLFAHTPIAYMLGDTQVWPVAARQCTPD